MAQSPPTHPGDLSSAQSFPADERYGLTSQIRPASASIAANLAEGSGRGSDGDFCRFVEIADGSACEVEYHLLLARDVQLIAEEHEALDSRINEIKKMLAGLSSRLRSPES